MITVGTWNVENFFSAGPFAPAPEVFAQKVRGIATTAVDAGVDVLALQEVGDDDAFGALLAALGSDWTGAASTFPDARGIRVAIASRLPMGDAEEVVDLAPGLTPPQSDDEGGTASRLGRGALKVTIRTAAGVVDVVTCHLKSKLVTYPGGRFVPRDEGERARFAAYALDRRAAEAATLRHYANTLLDGNGDTYRAVLLGDLNDEPTAATTQILQGPGGSEIGTVGALRPDQGDRWRLLNLAPLLPEGQRASRVFRGRGELIDQIFVSRALLPAIASAATLAPGPLASITEIATERRGQPISDHAMVVAALDLAA